VVVEAGIQMEFNRDTGGASEEVVDQEKPSISIEGGSHKNENAAAMQRRKQKY
jgi:hypothetical protein